VMYTSQKHAHAMQTLIDNSATRRPGACPATSWGWNSRAKTFSGGAELVTCSARTATAWGPDTRRRDRSSVRAMHHTPHRVASPNFVRWSAVVHWSKVRSGGLPSCRGAVAALPSTSIRRRSGCRPSIPATSVVGPWIT
jgi:hypothetical protein